MMGTREVNGQQTQAIRTSHQFSEAQKNKRCSLRRVSCRDFSILSLTLLFYKNTASSMIKDLEFKTLTGGFLLTRS